MTRLTIVAFFVTALAACSSGSGLPGGGSTCGAANQTCCPTSPNCGSGLSCVGGTCQAQSSCGGEGEQCCAGSVCGDGLTCQSLVCQVPAAPRCTEPYGDRSAFDASSSPKSLAAGDVDGDGDPDVVISGGTAGLFILRNQGAGVFETSAAFAVGNASHAVVADFDKDGHADVAVAVGGSSVKVLRGPGPTPYPLEWKTFTVGSLPLGLAVADFNADGNLDLAVANSGSDTVSLLMGDGAGGFAAKVDYAAGPRPMKVAAGDFDGDGKPDLVVPNYYATVDLFNSDISVLINNGDGTFKERVVYAYGVRGMDVSTADVNRDGHLDIVVTDLGSSNTNQGSIRVLYGAGDGTFPTRTWHQVGYSTRALAIGDLTGDAIADVVVTANESGAVAVLAGNHEGGLERRVHYGVNPEPIGVALADFDGDGDLDVAVGSFSDRTVQILENDGTGRLSALPFAPTGPSPVAMAAGHLNGDAIPDLVVSNSDGTLSVLLGHGDGRFDPPASLAVGSRAYGVAMGDVDGNGLADVITANADGTVSVFRGKGDGTFEAMQPTSVSGDLIAVAVGRFNGDLHDDVIVATRWSNGGLYYLESNGDGTFQPPVRIVEELRGALIAADIDGNGTMDVALTDTYSFYGSVTFFFGNGDGTFAEPVYGWYSDAIAAGDVNADGWLDFVVFDDYTSRVYTYLSNSGSGYLPRIDRSAPLDTFAIALPDLDGDGRLDLAMLGITLKVVVNKGDGTDLTSSTHTPGNAILAADFDGNGRDDLAVLRWGDDGVRILLSACP